MSVMIKSGGVWKTATPQIRVAGVWKRATEVWVKVAGVWKLSSFIATASPSQNDNGTSGNYTFSAVTVTVSGGKSPYTYLWAFDDGNGGSFSIVSGQATSSCVFRVAGVAADDGVGSTKVRCTVTDDVGDAALSNDVSLAYTNYRQTGGTGPEP